MTRPEDVVELVPDAFRTAVQRFTAQDGGVDHNPRLVATELTVT